jgi:hypothetical protein
MTTQACPVCLERYTTYKRRRLGCSFCPAEYCTTCFQFYLLHSGKAAPDCMVCFHALDMAVVRSTTPRTFYHVEYPRYVAQMLLLGERAKLPAAMMILVRHKQIAVLTGELAEAESRGAAEQALVMAEFRRIAAETRVQTLRIRAERDVLQNRAPRAPSRASYGCPVEQCRGLIFVGSKSCALCGGGVCAKCRCVVAQEEHACDPDTVATLELIVRDSRPCPNCQVSITKIDGCDQMWCPQCHTAFSWSRGTIDHGRIHAPGFYEYLRTRGAVPREVGDTGPCAIAGREGECAVVHDLAYLYVVWTARFTTTEVDTLAGYYRRIAAVEHYGRTRFPMVGREDQERQLEKMRLAYLRAVLTEQGWRAQLQALTHKMHRRNELRAVYRMSTATAFEILARTAVAPVAAEGLDAVFTELAALVQMTNAELDRVSREFQTVDLIRVAADYGMLRWSAPPAPVAPPDVGPAVLG